MANLEKLIKSWDALKNVPQQLSEDAPSRKKEKLSFCVSLADTFCSSQNFKSGGVNMLLSFAVESLLQMCNDSDSDVRMTADENLNRIIRQAIMESHAMKIQIELHKEIKRNGNWRSLRAALWRFAYLCHLIRPQKGKPYVNNLIPCLVQISKRTEEPLQETLSNAMPRMFKALGAFAMDKDVKVLLKAFISNLSSNSAQIRRAAASCVVSICQYSRKPQVFLTDVLNSLVDMLLPIHNEQIVSEILGVLGCLRAVIPLLVNLTDQLTGHGELKGSFGVQRKHEDVTIGIDLIIQVYELSLHFSRHADHNVVNAALELLHQILLSPPPGILPVLLSPQGISHSRIMTSDSQHQSTQSSISEIPVLETVHSDQNTDLEPDFQFPKTTLTDRSSLSKSVRDGPSSMSTEEESKLMTSIAIGSGTLQLLDTADHLEPEPLSSAEFDHSVDSISSQTVYRVSEAVRESTESMTPSTYSDVEHCLSPLSACGVSVCSPPPGPNQPDTKFQVCDIGSLTDGSIPLVYCARHLATSFLLTGHAGFRMPDRCVRVSVKALALNCIASIVRLHPNVFQLYLDKEPVSPSRRPTDCRASSQPLCDVLQYSEHTDPQLRAICCTLVASLIRSVLVQSGGNWQSWQHKADNRVARSLELSHLIQYLIKGLEDESSTTCRQTLVALMQCFSDLLVSRDSFEALPVFQALSRLSLNPYWLVKVKLVELVSELPYVTVQFICGSSAFQEKVINDILLKLLDDEDSRVRKATTEAIVRIIPNLCFLTDFADANIVNAMACYLSESYLSSLFEEQNRLSSIPYLSLKSHLRVRQLEILTPPYNAWSNMRYSQKMRYLEASLSRIIYSLYQLLLKSSSKYLTLGCCEALSLLATKYPATIYVNAWDCVCSTVASQSNLGKCDAKIDSTPPQRSPASGLLHTVLSLLLSSSVTLDLSTMQWLTSLAGNLFCGLAAANMCPLVNPSPAKVEDQQTSQLWTMFQDKQLIIAAESILLHVMRILNIILHILEDNSPTAATSKPGLPSLSPIKRHASSVGKHASSVDASAESKSGRGLSPIRNIIHGEKDDKVDDKKGGKNSSFGIFVNNQHYMKVYELFKSSYSNYKMSLETEVCEKFTSMVSSILQVLSQLLEVMTVAEAGRLAEELLSYLRSTMSLSPVSTVHCVNQLLKCVVGMNLSSLRSDKVSRKSSGSHESTSVVSVKGHGFYFHGFSQPFHRLSQFLASVVSKPTNVEVTHAAGWMNSVVQRCDANSVFALGKTADTSFLASYIRLFEPVVIESLQQYTVTSDVQLQVKVLLLLTQLVQLRVNYCLLDSEMVFIGFIHKQFEFIEEGQIPNVEALITCIFHFMVLLSFEKHHSKSVTTIPKVIQLCDGLMASGQNPLTHCIPALLPVVQHGFLSKGSAGAVIDAEELETQREVMVAMLLRLVEYHQVMELLNLVLIECRNWHDGEERWKRWSRQVIDVVLSLLATGRLRLDSLSAQQALHQLLLHSIAPDVLWPADPLLKVLFAQPPPVESSTQSIIRWLGTVLAIVLVLVAQGKEDETLAKIRELNISLSTPFFRVSAVDLSSPDPLNVASVATKQNSSASPQLTFARLVLCTIGLVGEKIDSAVMDPASSFDTLKECHYLQELLAHFLLVCIYMFQSGNHCKITNAAIDLVAGHATEDSILLEDANAVFFELAPACPLLMFLWCYLLTLLNYNNHAFWKRVLHPSPQSSSSDDESEYSKASHSITMEVVRTGAAIVYCDFVCENPTETEQLSWLLKTQMMRIVELSTEPPVQELIAVLHRSPEYSGCILQAFQDNPIRDTKATTVIRLLRFFEGIHPSHSGTLLLLLAERFVGLPHPTLARRAAQLCTRQAEYLLTLPPPQAAQHLSREQLRDVIHSLHHSHLNRKHSGLVSILNKLGSQCLALSPLETAEARPVTPSSVQSLQLDKNWYLSQVKVRCSQAACTAVVGEESALLLGRLDVEDAVSVLSSPDTHLSVLQLCFRHGTHQTIQARTENSASDFEDSLSPLYRAARMVLMQHVHHFIELMPKDHEVFLPVDRHMTEAEKSYSVKFREALYNVVQLESLFRIAAAVTSYLQSLQKLSGCVPSEATQDLALFALLCLEAVHCLVSEHDPLMGCDEEDTSKIRDKSKVSDLSSTFEDIRITWSMKNNSSFSLKNWKSPQPYCLRLGLDCASQVMNESSLCASFERPEHSSWLASACSSVCAVLYFALQGEALPGVPQIGLAKALSNPETLSIAHACHQMSMLVTYLEKLSQGLCSHNIPDFLFSPIRKLIVHFSRAPLLNSYVWTPPEVWRHGWNVDLVGSCFTHVPPLPTDFLQDMEVLRQFIFRVMLLGWTSRQQFEETWMSLLSVLSAETSVDEMPAEEVVVTVQANILVVKAITALLMQTLLLPEPGNPNTSQYMYITRDKKNDYTATRSMRKLYKVQQLLLWKQETLHGKDKHSVFDNPNLEQIVLLKRFCYNQVSVEYLKYGLEGMHGESRNDFFSKSVMLSFDRRKAALERSGLDLNSCLYFLLDLFTQWVQPQISGVIGFHSRLVHEVLCSALAVSDLFTEQSQWQWLLQMSLDLARHQPPEDDVSQQYIILAQCKACAVLQPEPEVFERTRRVLEIALKSSFIPTISAALRGLLYLLESIVLSSSLRNTQEVEVDVAVSASNNTSVPLSTSDETFGIVQVAADYVIKNLSPSGVSSLNEEVCLLTWTVALYLLDNENVWKIDVMDQASRAILQHATNVGYLNTCSPPVQKVVMQGLEHLVVSQSGALSHQTREQITKFAVETITDPNTSLLFHSLQLLLSCMYIGCSESTTETPLDSSGSDAMDPEQLVQAMEKTSALFDRIRKGYPQEVQLICSVLPHLLTDFFPASEVLTKVIGEFLSPQQPHPRLLSGVVFQVFECAVAQSQLSLLQEWFVLSLSNFTQTLPVPMATWCLTCFFISASCNPWLRALFPHVQSRIGRCEFEDRKLLCLSAADFYRQLTSPSQTSKFLSTFQAAAERQPNSPFGELVSSLI